MISEKPIFVSTDFCFNVQCNAFIRTSEIQPLKIFGYLFFFAGCALASLVIFRDLHLATSGIVTNGVVEQVTEKASSSSSRKRVKGHKQSGYDSSRNATSLSYFIDVRFTPMGTTEPVIFTTRSTFGEQHQVGDEVKVIYLQETPQNAEIFSNEQVWYPIYAGTVFSLAILGIGLFMIRMSRPRSTNYFNPLDDRFS